MACCHLAGFRYAQTAPIELIGPNSPIRAGGFPTSGAGCPARGIGGGKMSKGVVGIRALAVVMAIIFSGSDALAACRFLECAPGEERTPSLPPIPQTVEPGYTPPPARDNAIMPASPGQVCAGAGDTSYCASSVLPPQHGFTYGPEKLLDGRLETAWSPAGSVDGIGEWLLVKFPSPRAVKAINLLNGYHKNQSIFLRNSRLRGFVIRTSSGWSKAGEFKDEAGLQRISIDDPSQIVWLQLAIRSVYSGSKYRDVAITELRVD